jgi:hypothetical protein
MAEDLTKVGLDPLHLPPLDKLPPDTIRKLMPLFARSLGVKCVACHDANDFKAWTPKKKIAAGMWQRFVVGLAFKDGNALFCDSCHGGRMEFLDRRDQNALTDWMARNYVAPLKRTDGNGHDCATCHGEPFVQKPLATWAKRR